MTRRDRLAMELALDCLRRSCALHSRRRAAMLGTALSALHLGDRLSAELLRALHIAGELTSRPRSPRQLRALLALALRALLRADRDDYAGRFECPKCDADERSDRIVVTSHRCWTCGVPSVYTLRLTPLWEIAPAHGARR